MAGEKRLTHKRKLSDEEVRRLDAAVKAQVEPDFVKVGRWRSVHITNDFIRG